MKHKIKKELYEICVGDKSVIVTEDHSVIVQNKNDNNIHSIKPKKLNPKHHKIINIITNDTDSKVVINAKKIKCN